MGIKIKDKCIGALLGTAVGDTLGAAVEGSSLRGISQHEGELRDFKPSRAGRVCYTDDTQMTLALATSVVECSRIDPKHCSQTYAEFFEPWRGYGWGARRVLIALKNGADYRQTGWSQFKDGSFGNGGAMRIAPIGLVYRNKDKGEFKRAVYDAIMCTHVHPEGVDGALIQAKAVAQSTNTVDPFEFDPGDCLEVLYNLAETNQMRTKITYLKAVLRDDIDDKTAVKNLGNGIIAIEAVSCALLAVIRYHSQPEEAVIKSVNFGGDTDTIGAMTGAVIGALHGTDWIPKRWFDNLENDKYGRDYIVDIGTKLADVEV